MSYLQHGVKLTDGQKQKLARAYKNNEAITIRLSNSQLTGPDEMMLTKTQINRIRKAKANGLGLDLKISKSQIRKAVKQGGSLFSSLIPLMRSLAPTLGKTLGLRALAGLASEGASQIVKKVSGKGQSGGFLIPQNKIEQLIKHKNLLTQKQKQLIQEVLQSGGQLFIKPTAKLRGGFLGTLLASIGIPMLLNAITGKALQVDRLGRGFGRGLQI